jgi:hypothetical protein
MTAWNVFEKREGGASEWQQMGEVTATNRSAQLGSVWVRLQTYMCVVVWLQTYTCFVWRYQLGDGLAGMLRCL